MFVTLSVKCINSSLRRGYKVAVLGAGGECGQAISLLLKLDPKVTELSLYDLHKTRGITSDLSHIHTRAQVTGHVGKEELNVALKDCKIVVIPAGVPRVLGNNVLNRDSLFDINASIVRDLAVECAKTCPEAMILIISNPVNSIVPLVADTLKRFGKKV